MVLLKMMRKLRKSINEAMELLYSDESPDSQLNELQKIMERFPVKEEWHNPQIAVGSVYYDA